MIRPIKTVALATTLVSSLSAFAISKVGNQSVGDPALGFTAPIPQDYFFERETSDTTAVLSGMRTIFDPGRPPRQSPVVYLFASHFSRHFPQLSELSRSELAEHFLGANSILYQKISSPYPCADLFLGRSESTDLLVAFWGPQKGAVFSGQVGTQTLRALREIAAGLELDEGACAWE